MQPGINLACFGYYPKEHDMRAKSQQQQFESAVLPHLDAAYNLARWMMGNDGEARDAVQSASLRALNYIASLRNGQSRPWFLGIVRNCCLNQLRERSGRLSDVDVAVLVDGHDELDTIGSSAETLPDEMLMQRNNREHVNTALRRLAVVYREVLILREMEELSYEQIASITGVPTGTVMSRLSRARQQFRQEFLALNEGYQP